LDFLKVTYDQNNHFPVWPFNVQILIKFVTLQAVPVLGLTGLSQPILNVVDALTKILEHQG
jgi:hypothetical protein